MKLKRSFLFAPGNHPRKVEKVFGAGADAVILDLEDAVAIAEKEASRTVVVDAMQAPRPCLGYIRINALDTGLTFGDLEVVVAQSVDGIVLPKVETASDIAKVEWVMGELERKAGLEPGSIDLLPIIETGLGVANARQICAAGGRMRCVSFGAGDYTRDMAMDWTLSEHECGPARAEIVLASRIAGLEPPVDTVWIHLKDDAGLRSSAQTVKEMGFQGKLCIHPDQVETIHSVFTPGEEEIAQARRIVEAFEASESEGSASIQLDGYFIDYPIVERARRQLALARAAGLE